MNKGELNLTEGPIRKQLLRFFFPLWCGMLFQTLYSTADALIVGQLVGSNALAAVGNTSAVINIYVGFYSGLAAGATVLSSQYSGSEDIPGLRRCSQTALMLAAWLGLAIGVAGWALSPWTLRLIETPELILQDSIDYLQIYSAGMVAMSIYNIGAGILRGLGDARRPVIILAVSGGLNVVLDLLLVTWIPMGVRGVALATSVSQGVSAVMVLYYILCGRIERLGRLRVNIFSMDRKMAVRLAGIAIPAAVLSGTYNVTNLLVQVGINSFDVAAIAAWTTYGKADTLYWLTVNAASSTLTSFAGQNYGAGNLKRMRDGLHTTVWMTGLVAVISSVILLLWYRPLFSIFTNDAEVLAIGGRMVLCIAPFYILFVIEELYSATVRASGDSVRPMILNLLSICGVRLVWVLLLLPHRHTMEFLCLCYAVSWGAGMILFLLYYRFGRWEKRGLKLGTAKDGLK